MPNFYCFNEINYNFQPEGSSWCWAACLSNISIGLNSKSTIGKFQCDIVSHYKKFLSNFNPNINTSNCCNNTISTSCNIRLDDKHVNYIFGKVGFYVNCFSDYNQLNDFDFIIESLNNNQAPIVLKTIINKSAHMVLINGYGTKPNGCNYILISDPDNSKNEVYFNHEYYLKNHKIEKFWTLKSENSNNLKKDAILTYNANYIKNLLNSNGINKNSFSKKENFDI
ncbi:hypothetical protein N9V96_01985, partial [Polaribacter sp.]|nr:hypothetical protein [Polaribacter sp.]